MAFKNDTDTSISSQASAAASSLAGGNATHSESLPDDLPEIDGDKMSVLSEADTMVKKEDVIDPEADSVKTEECEADIQSSQASKGGDTLMAEPAPSATVLTYLPGRTVEEVRAMTLAELHQALWEGRGLSCKDAEGAHGMIFPEHDSTLSSWSRGMRYGRERLNHLPGVRGFVNSCFEANSAPLEATTTIHAGSILLLGFKGQTSWKESLSPEARCEKIYNTWYYPCSSLYEYRQ